MQEAGFRITPRRAYDHAYFHQVLTACMQVVSSRLTLVNTATPFELNLPIPPGLPGKGGALTALRGPRVPRHLALVVV